MEGTKMTIWQEILEMLKTAWTYFVDSGLAKDCADVVAEIVSFDSEKMLWLMWDIINKVFGG
jgi:hypothetical protein